MRQWATRLQMRWRRELSARCHRRRADLPGRVPVVSFSFDDFPASAAGVAGARLHALGLRGTFYTSFGLEGTTAPTGQIFSRAELHEVVAQGHELGCHTFQHCHAWDTPPSEFLASIDRNAAAAAAVFPGMHLSAFSYPISCPHPANKAIAGRRFATCRGGGQTFNRGAVDRAYLNAFFLEKSRADPAAIRKVIHENARHNGWLILVTHDVSVAPTPFGVSPQLFELVLQAVRETGAEILPVGEAAARFWPN